MRQFLIVLFVFISFTEAFTQPKSIKRIGLINPTSKNLENVLVLVQNGFIKADSLQIVGIFHESQKEALEASKQYVEKHGYHFISFELIHNIIPIDSLFLSNRNSAEFLRLFRKTDAMIFPGGADIFPGIYGEKTFLTTELIPIEKNWELSFLYHLIGGSQSNSYVPLLEQRPDYTILGICLGMQEMNVASGGSLYQDIPFQIYKKKTYNEVMQLPKDKLHKNYASRVGYCPEEISVINLHQIKISKNSFLQFGSTKGSPLVPSIHHQAVKKLGKNFRVSATSKDGKVIEAFENIKYKNVYGIQFHLDLSALYNEDSEIKGSSEDKLDKTGKRFHRDFWVDFSNRLKGQK